MRRDIKAKIMPGGGDVSGSTVETFNLWRCIRRNNTV
jgi:hypothetical protein